MFTRIAFRTRSRWLICIAALTLPMMASTTFAAGFGGALQPGSTACTDWLRTDGGGVYLRGHAGGTGAYTWTMRMSASPGGAETEIFRVTTREVTQHVVPSVTGRFFYRNCLTVANRQATFYRLGVSAGVRSVNPVYGIGPHTATLAPGSSACGEFAMGPVFLRGGADRSIQWSVRGTDLDYSPVGDIFSVRGAAVDQLIDVPSWLFSVDTCATNGSSAPATVSFDFIDP
jgi:hypothetical protein